VDTAAVSLIAFAMVLWATFTAVGGILDRSESGIDAFVATREQLYRDADTSIEVVNVGTTISPGSTLVDVTVSNIGRRSFSSVELEGWEVYLDYVPVTSLERRIVRLAFAESLDDNTWVVRDVYLDHESEQNELINPGVLDPHEELVMRLQVSPLIELDTAGQAVLYVPGSSQPLVAFFTVP
jgi:hypothetical protein